MKRHDIKHIIIAILIPITIGLISAILTKNGTNAFKTLNKPTLSPPAIVFPIAWTILYILMGIASYFLYKNEDYLTSNNRRKALILYAIQLFFNFFWSIIFFNLKAYYFAFFWLLIMWILILLLLINSEKVDKKAFYLLLPYMIWTTFAGYLNIMIAILN